MDATTATTTTTTTTTTATTTTKRGKFLPSLKIQYLDHIFLGLVLHSSTVTVNIITTEHIGKEYGQVILLYDYLKQPLDLN